LARLVALVLPLCLDTFAVSVALGLAGLSRRQRIQISIVFPAAEIAMPAVGLAAGHGLARTIGDAADYVAAAIVIAVGVYLLAEDETEEAERASRLVKAGGWAVVALTAGIALDELALGFSIGLLRLSFVAAVIMIAVQAVLASQLGLLLGSRVGERLRESAARVAGLALVGIGIFLLVERLAR
jgi:manganese efflux pump family protein